MISQRVQWQLGQPDGTLQPFNMFINSQLETKYLEMQNDSNNDQNQRKVRLMDEKGEFFEVDVDSMTAIYDKNPNVTLGIVRSDVIESIVFPKQWTSPGLDLVTVDPKSKEYADKVNFFKDNGLSFNSVREKKFNFLENISRTNLN